MSLERTGGLVSAFAVRKTTTVPFGQKDVRASTKDISVQEEQVQPPVSSSKLSTVNTENAKIQKSFNAGSDVLAKPLLQNHKDYPLPARDPGQISRFQERSVNENFGLHDGYDRSR
jgi:hypothetical protein